MDRIPITEMPLTDVLGEAVDCILALAFCSEIRISIYIKCLVEAITNLEHHTVHPALGRYITIAVEFLLLN